MGLFSRKQSQSSITFAPGAVNLDAQAANTTGAVSLDEAKRALRLSVDQDLRDDAIWRVRSADCHALQGDDYWLGTLTPKGDTIAVSVGKKQVGTLEMRWLPSGVKILKANGGKQARCVISKTSDSSWNIYVNML